MQKKTKKAFATPKGGVGKTTIAVNIAYLRAKEKGSENVLLVDADSKTGTATIWTGLRSERPELLQILTIAKTGDKDFVKTINLLSEKYTDIIIDVGGDNETELLASMAVVDEIYVPARPSFIDTFRFYALNNKVAQAQASINPNLKAYLLPSVVSPNKLMVADDLKEIKKLASELTNLIMVENFIYERKAFRRSPKFDGKTIFELEAKPYLINGVEIDEKRDENAIEDMIKFYKEIYPD